MASQKETPSKTAKKIKKKASVSPRRKGPSTKTLRQRADQIERSLFDLASDIQRNLFGGPDEADGTVDLKLHVSEGLGKNVEFHPSGIIFEQVRQAVREAGSRREAFQSGRLYCHRCASALCEHSAPPRPASVFSGYEPTGLPGWTDMLGILLHLKDERVDRLYANPPRWVGRTVSGRILKEKLLPSFGRASKTYDVLGQVIAGYFGIPRKTADDSGPDRFALTLQAVEWRDKGGHPRIDLNILCGLPPEVEWADVVKNRPEERLLDAVRLLRRDLRSLDSQLGRTAVEDTAKRTRILGRIPSLLERGARTLERMDRQKGRRTQHADTRRKDQRPTHAALQDLDSANEETVYWDEWRNTLVVSGPKGRFHIFSSEGRHVTTLSLPPEAVESRLRRKRWRPATVDEIGTVKKKIQDSTKKDSTETESSS